MFKMLHHTHMVLNALLHCKISRLCEWGLDLYILNFILWRAPPQQRIYCHGPEFPEPLCQLCRPKIVLSKKFDPEPEMKTIGKPGGDSKRRRHFSWWL